MTVNVKILTKNDAKVTLYDLIMQVKKSPEIDECGAIFSFEGIVRGKEKDKNIRKLILSTQDIQKTEEELKDIIKEIKNKYNVAEIAVVHYIGEFYTGDSLFLVVVAGGHRGKTSDALKETIERVKFDLEFKKEEITDNGTNIIMSGG